MALNYLIDIPHFAGAGKQSFSSNRQKKRERGGKREPQFSTIFYGPPKSRRSGVAFHYFSLSDFVGHGVINQ